ncbi:M24 family metallopeptidase [Bryobacter aggregatus]|uniref:M24 family metallopeptidase n=1 Tax=Bryobacter aggregatus TaxID=360054 RepID=UPI000B1365C5|nr:M24 family metallopeptidase [Bryobacter aggregatus]
MWWLLLPLLAFGAEPLPSLREQASIQQSWLQYRLEKNLPALLRKHGVDMWVVSSREYNEDPVFFSLVSPTMFAARRRTIYVFFDRGPEKGVERLALGGGSQGGLYEVYRDPDSGIELWGDQQWMLLKKLIDARKPKKIAIDVSQTHAFSDGLSAGEREQLEEAIGEENRKKLVRAEELPLEYVALRPPEMVPHYQRLMENVHSILSRAFSREVIEPGKTTDQDVIWWLRQENQKHGFGTWFQPSLRIQRKNGRSLQLLQEDQPTVIERGDVLWVDYGLTAMRLATDTQHMGYVLREGEDVAPVAIQKALENSKKMQDIVMAHMQVGKTGNEVLAAALQEIRALGINGTVYSHPIGDHGHGAGPLIGLWDRQQGVPGRGDVKVVPNTWFSIELSSRTKIPDWENAELFVGMEEDAMVGPDGKIRWVLRRQEKFHLIR